MQKTENRLLLVVATLLLLAACQAATTTDDVIPGVETVDVGPGGHMHDNGEHNHGHDDHHGAPASAPEPFEGAKEIRVTGYEWGFEPATLRLAQGEAVNIVFVNEGTVEHEIAAPAFDFHLHAAPGETATAGFLPEAAGEFELGCYLSGHYEAGMAGTLLVEGQE